MASQNDDDRKYSQRCLDDIEFLENKSLNSPLQLIDALIKRGVLDVETLHRIRTQTGK